MANPKLTDTQRVVLAAAAARDTGQVLPLPKSLGDNRGTHAIVLRSLLTKGLISEVPASQCDPVWQQQDDGERRTLLISTAGMEAIGIELGTSDRTPAPKLDTWPGGDASPTPSDERRAGQKRRAERGTTSPNVVSGVARKDPERKTKLGAVIAALRGKGGATIPDLMELTKWQAHSVRGAISGALKKKLGLQVDSAAVEGRGRVYRIAGEAE